MHKKKGVLRFIEGRLGYSVGESNSYCKIENLEY